MLGKKSARDTYSVHAWFNITIVIFWCDIWNQVLLNAILFYCQCSIPYCHCSLVDKYNQCEMIVWSIDLQLDYIFCWFANQTNNQSKTTIIKQAFNSIQCTNTNPVAQIMLVTLCGSHWNLLNKCWPVLSALNPSNIKTLHEYLLDK